MKRCSVTSTLLNLALLLALLLVCLTRCMNASKSLSYTSGDEAELIITDSRYTSGKCGKHYRSLFDF